MEGSVTVMIVSHRTVFRYLSIVSSVCTGLSTTCFRLDIKTRTVAGMVSDLVRGDVRIGVLLVKMTTSTTDLVSGRGGREVNPLASKRSSPLLPSSGVIDTLIIGDINTLDSSKASSVATVNPKRAVFVCH